MENGQIKRMIKRFAAGEKNPVHPVNPVKNILKYNKGDDR